MLAVGSHQRKRFSQEPLAQSNNGFSTNRDIPVGTSPSIVLQTNAFARQVLEGASCKFWKGPSLPLIPPLPQSPSMWEGPRCIEKGLVPRLRARGGPSKIPGCRRA